MHKLEQIKEEVIEKIESTYKDHSNLEPAVLDYLDKLAHFGKNLGKLCEPNDEGFSMRSYRDGMSRGRSYEGSYEDGSFGGEAYARGRRNARRDSMGRYSGEGGYSREDGYSRGTWDTVDKIEDLIREAPDEQTRQELQRIAGRMRNG